MTKYIKEKTFNTENQYDIIIIGAGPAGLAAALGSKHGGAKKVLIIDRDNYVGGILNQCIHPGFGLKRFSKELTGPEYAYAFQSAIERENGIQYLLDSYVHNIDSNKTVIISNTGMGIRKLKARAIVLAMGCREASRGSIHIPGYRPAGIFSAGTAQRLINIEGLMPGKKIVILGSGDIGLIMARRFTLEGAEVKGVIEKMPYPGGLSKNVVQCLEDFDIPLYLSHTVTFIDGKERVKGVKIAAVDTKGKTLQGTEKYIECDTLLLSIGLIPENELTRNLGIDIDPLTMGPIVDNMMHTSEAGIFACGNVVHVYDLVDYVSEDSYIAGFYAAEYSKKNILPSKYKTELIAGTFIRYIIPQYIIIPTNGSSNSISFRINEPLKKTKFILTADGKNIATITKQYAVPSEMVRLGITKYLPDIKGKRYLRIDAEEVRS